MHSQFLTFQRQGAEAVVKNLQICTDIEKWGALTQGAWAGVSVPLGTCTGICNPSERQHDTLLSSKTRRSLSAKRGCAVSCPCSSRGKVGDDTLPACFVKGAQPQKNSALERETGLEPATPCLEGRYSTN